MEYIKRIENNTRVDVYFDGEKYVFINAFHGCVAVARRERLVEFTNICSCSISQTNPHSHGWGFLLTKQIEI